MEKKSILVIGAAGELGNLICKEIKENYRVEWNLYIGDYKSNRGKQLAEKYGASFSLIDLENREYMLNLLKSIDAIIVAMKQKEPLIQEYCFQSNTLCVDVTAFASFAKKVESSFEKFKDTQAISVVMGGFFPGFSGLLLKDAVGEMDSISQADIILVQNISAVAGVTGMLDMFKIIQKPTDYGFGNEKIYVPGFTKKNLVKPVASKRDYTIRLIHHSEKEWLLEKMPLTNIHYWTGWNSAAFNRVVYHLIHTKWFDKWIQKPNHPFLKKIRKDTKPKDETAYLVVIVKGKEKSIEKKVEWHVKTFSDYGITAIMAAAVTDLTLKMNKKGVFHPAEIIKWEVLSPKMMRNDVSIARI